MKKRFCYANWGELTRTRKLGAVATAIAASGTQTIALAGAKPGSVVLRQGEFFSVEGHRWGRWGRCQPP